jgi:hypothetical protein
VNCDKAFGEYDLGNSGKSVERAASDGGNTVLDNNLGDLILICSVGLILGNAYEVVLGVTVAADGENTVGGENPSSVNSASTACYNGYLGNNGNK